MSDFNMSNGSCNDTLNLKAYQHHIYAVVYSVILVPGLLGNVLALWVFRIYMKETKKAVVFMMNLAVADFLQVLSLPLRIYYYLNNTWPFGLPLCMFCFYLKYVNMYASIYFLVLISVRRCKLIMHPLSYKTPTQKRDWLVCGLGWLLVCICCLAFPLLRTNPRNISSNNTTCFSELPLRQISNTSAWFLLIAAELLGFIIPLTLVLVCACKTAGSLKKTVDAVPDRGEKRRALKMVLSCAVVFLVCFAPYHITMPLDFLAKAKTLSNCSFRDFIQRTHILTLCLASLNCCLDPVMYYFTTNEFWKRLSKAETPESMMFPRRLSCLSGGEDLDDR